jgi:hypothetical protein
VSTKKRYLIDLLDVWAVHDPGMWENELSPLLKDWFAVSSDDAGGIVAYFAEEKDAYRYRLDQINRELNG